MKRAREFYEKNLLAAEFCIAFLICVLIISIIEIAIGRDEFIDSLNNIHQVMYGTIAAVSSSLLGFVITEVSIILVLGQMPQLAILRKSGHFNTIFQINFQAILWLGLATGW